MKYLILATTLIILIAGCSMRLAGVAELGEASYNGSTSITRQQDTIPQKQFSTLEGIIRGEEAYTESINARPTPTPVQE